MPRYTFTFKKDDIFVEFTTEDRDVVERQFQIWVADADNYARNQKSKPAATKTINIVALPKEEIKVQEPEKPAEQSEENVPQELPVTETASQEIPEVKEEQIIDKASSLLKTINSMQSEQIVEETSSEKAEEVAATIEDVKPIENVDFEAVLEKTIENPTFEPDRTKDQVFLNFVKSKNTNDKFHYLIITAYYLSEFEKLERFSLKQINAKLMQNFSEVIDHATLQDALTQNFLELVPDLTGVSEVGEYKLTRAGEEFFASNI